MSSEKKTKKEEKREERKNKPIEGEEVGKFDESKFNAWLNDMYDVSTVTKEDVDSLYDMFKYQGFNRDDMLKALYVAIPDKKIFTEIVIVCALRGPKNASESKLSNGRTVASYGIPASGGQKTRKLTCARITASTADLAAYFLKRMKAPKRVDVPCPGWLQFPAAGSIRLPDDHRAMHIEFSKRFSPMIKGAYNESIYMQMVHNAYLNPGLNLFGD
jgi:hypothetical protein